MQREIDALLRAYAERQRKQAANIEKLAKAISELAEADERFRRVLAEAFQPVRTYEPQRHGQSMNELFRTLDSLSPEDLEAMRRAVP